MHILQATYLYSDLKKNHTFSRGLDTNHFACFYIDLGAEILSPKFYFLIKM